MSELDPEKESQKSASEDEELDSLSADEKAAFEKIMAEIAAATGNSPQEKDDTGEPAEKGGPPDSPPSAAASSSEDAVDGHDNPSTDQVDETAEQQADLDQIMAEIDSKRNSGQAAGSPDEEDQPDEEQQAPLDQILADIESKRKGKDSDEFKNALPESEPEDLSADQQAALDQIMSEIESKRKGEKKPPPVSAAVEDDEDEDENLSADQQAALDQIMSEIQSKRAPEKQPDRTDIPEEETASADVEKIMAEIEAKKRPGDSKSRNDAADIEKADPQNSGAEKKPEKEGLTMEEFDDELSHLLSQTKKEYAQKETPKPKLAGATTDHRIAVGSAPKPKESSNPVPQTPPLPSEDEPNAQQQDYAVFHEVRVDPEPQAESPARKTAAGGKKHRRGLRTLTYRLVTAAAIAVLCAGLYWGYHRFFSPAGHRTAAPTPASQEKPIDTAIESVQDLPAMAQPVVASGAGSALPSGARARLEMPSAALAELQKDLSAARSRSRQKLFDLEELKSYYNRGVTDDVEKVEEMLTGGAIPSLEKALAAKKIELALRAVQRRKTYAAKLETPLARLRAISEELLYLQRRAHTYEILNRGIVGLPIEKFKADVAGAIASHMQYLAALSIDDVQAQTPSLASIWEEIVSAFRHKASLLARRAPLNRKVSAEICNGQYDRKYLLTVLSAQTANCLIKWPGKDMYLNGLVELSSETARALSQWQGEWLSLNGVKELSPEAAKYLSQWPGQRLSLNGLKALSPEATEYLSQWRGAQLEMVGLRSIGPWKNYGTRLFLSEKLRRQLEAQ